MERKATAVKQPLLRMGLPPPLPQRGSWDGQLEVTDPLYTPKQDDGLQFVIGHNFTYPCNCGNLWQVAFLKLVSLL